MVAVPIDLSVIGIMLYAILLTPSRAIRFPPSFTAQPKFLTIYNLRSEIVLPCEASGRPAPKFHWKRNKVIWNKFKDHRAGKENGTVIIKNPTKEDEGWYQCFATNRLGHAMTQVVQVKMAHIDQIQDRTTEIVKGYVGQSITLPCAQTASYPEPSVRWMYREAGEDAFLRETTRIAMDLKGNLIFTALWKNDTSKVYFCRRLNKYLGVSVLMKKMRIQLEPSSKPFLQEKPIRILYRSKSAIVALANDTIRMRCIFEGEPLTIRWTKDGELQLPSGIKIRAQGVELRIWKFESRHIGTYRCHGSNNIDPAGESADFDVRMESKPVWKSRPHNRLVAANSSLQLKCHAQSVPPPELTWKVNGIHLNGYIDSNKFFVGPNLVLNDLQVDDTAVIQCNASNIHGSIFVNAYVNVLKDPPEFRQPPSDLKSPEGKRTVMTCETYSAPTALVTWFHNNTRLVIPEYPGQRMHLTPEGNLVIERAEEEDSGIYRCEARNSFGVVRKSGMLTITRATTITTPLKSQTILEDRVAKFHCQATTDVREFMNLKVRWHKNGIPLDIASNQRLSRRKISGETLIISAARPSDSGVYECLAFNGLDEARSNATLLVQGRPDAPMSVTVDCHSRRRQHLAVLRWKPGADNNAPISRYDVQFALVRRNDSRNAQAKMKWFAAEVNMDGTSSSPHRNWTTVRLRPWLNYTFRVTAHNKVGASAASVPTSVHCGLPAAPPTRNPRDLRVSGSKPNQLDITWTPMSPLDQNGPGLVYHLTVACLTCQGMEPMLINKTKVADWRQKRLVLRNLIINGQEYGIETYKQYRVTIKAENQLGPSSASALEVKGYSGEDRPLTRPTELRVVENNDPKSHLVRLIWKKPSDLNERRVRGRFRGYRVHWCSLKMSIRQCDREMQYKDILNSDDSIREQAPPGFISVTLASLPGLVRLRIWVCVINTHYCGDPSNKVIVETKEGVPGPVSEFNMVSMGANHLDFEWAKPLQVNGRLTGFQLGILKLDQIKDPTRPMQASSYPVKHFPPINDPEQLSDRIIGLYPNTNYRVYIWARTSQGNGKETHLDVRTANANVPSEPKFRVHSVSGTSLNVTLLPNAFVMSPGGTGYLSDQYNMFYVQYQKSGTEEWEQTRIEYAPRRWILLTGLEANTIYYLRVVAGPSAAAAGYSKPMQVRTDDSSGVESLFASGLIWLVVLGCAVLCLGVFLVGLCYFRHKRLKYGESPQQRGKPLPTQEAEKTEQNDYTMPEQITRLPGSGTLQRPMRDFTNHHDTLYMTKLGAPCLEDPNDMSGTANGRGNGYGYTSLTKSPVNTIPTSFV